ncbi:potassium-transporting ATPase subunit F [Halobacillus sp. K22]
MINMLLFLLSLGVFGYLGYALIHPEKF